MVSPVFSQYSILSIAGMTLSCSLNSGTPRCGLNPRISTKRYFPPDCARILDIERNKEIVRKSRVDFNFIVFYVSRHNNKYQLVQILTNDSEWVKKATEREGLVCYLITLINLD